MYPAHTQLLAKWSSPSIGDRRATGCDDKVFSDYFEIQILKSYKKLSQGLKRRERSSPATTESCSILRVSGIRQKL